LNARSYDIELHLEAFQTLKGYEGMSGKVKALSQDLRSWIKRNGEPKKLSEAWYAQEEITKITRAVQQARQELSNTPMTRQQASTERAKLRYWEQEIERHRQTLAAGSRGRGATPR
jgi:hypothetical protein